MQTSKKATKHHVLIGVLILGVLTIGLSFNLIRSLSIESGDDTNDIDMLKSLHPEVKRHTEILNYVSDLQYPDIDVVYTWVNGSDPQWQKKKDEYEQLGGLIGVNDSATALNRFRNHDELRYSLRSVEKHAPWVRSIYIIVADGQAPTWLNRSSSRIKLVNHSTIFPNPNHLPVFSGVAVEANLDRIPELSDYFVYFNDDTFLGKPVTPADFFLSPQSGDQRWYLETWGVNRFCQPRCFPRLIGDGICQSACNHSYCGWDRGDCGQEVIRKGMDLIQHSHLNSSGSGDFYKSLKYTDHVYYRAFGPPTHGTFRKAIQHVPHLINKRLMKDMKQRFAREFNWTSSHRFRHPQDMQFAFSYVYYVDGVGVYAPSKPQIWRSALLNALRKQSLEPLSPLQKCAEVLVTYENTTEEFVQDCDRIVDELYPHVRLPSTQYVLGHRSDVSFRMIQSSTTMEVAKSVLKLRRIALHPSKFVTINDDMTRPSVEIESAYLQLYTTLFPSVSSDEL